MADHRHYELATGSRACDDTDAASAWAREVARAMVASLPPRAVVVVGDALGFDAIVRVWARDAGLTVLVFALDATVRRYEGLAAPVRDGHWTNLDPPPRGSAESQRWPLRRNAAMVEYVRRRAAEGSPTHCTAAACPWCRPGRARATGGTQWTATRAAAAGVPVTTHACPAELGPAAEVPRG